MNCPFCHRTINAWTGFQEAEKFTKHLSKCRKNPNNLAISDGKRTAVVAKRPQDMQDALMIRMWSGQ